MGTKTKSKSIIEIGTFFGIFVAVVALWLIGWVLIDAYIKVDVTDATPPTSAESVSVEKDNFAARGQFGDKFGAVNSLFSGFAFAGIIITLLLQRRDLKETQNAMWRERFDSTFFQLLQLHKDITSKLKFRGGPTGIDALIAFDEKLRNSDVDFVVFQALQKINNDEISRIKDSKQINASACPELTVADIANLQTRLATGTGFIDNFRMEDINYHKAKIIQAYTITASQHIDDFSHYFRNLYHIFKFVDSARELSEEEKKVYTNFIRSQLSDIELVCLFYNSIAKIALPGREEMELGYPKMHALLNRYNILQNMNPRSLIHPKHIAVFNS